MKNPPDFLGIGVVKSGTTWLSHHLRRHPNVFMPGIKELRFFNSLDRPDVMRANQEYLEQRLQLMLKKAIEPPVSYEWLHRLTLLGVGKPFTPEWYDRQFEIGHRRGMLSGEISPQYYTISEKSFERLHAMMPNVKIILMVRHPLDRLRSDIRMFYRNRPEYQSEPLDKVLLDFPFIADRSRYSRVFPRWFEQMDESRLLAIPFGHVARKPEAVLRQVEAHLGLSEHIYPGLDRTIAGAPTDQTLPPEFEAQIADMVEGEYDFVRDFFGDEFAQET